MFSFWEATSLSTSKPNVTEKMQGEDKHEMKKTMNILEKEWYNIYLI
jgi:hypothetical protein